jgi:hypothetical protein
MPILMPLEEICQVRLPENLRINRHISYSDSEARPQKTIKVLYSDFMADNCLHISDYNVREI